MKLERFRISNIFLYRVFWNLEGSSNFLDTKTLLLHGLNFLPSIDGNHPLSFLLS